MGFSISYKGKLRKKNQLNNLVNELKDIAEIMEWRFSMLDEDWNAAVDANIVTEKAVQKITGNCGLKGIAVTPHPYCETLNFYFDKNGWLNSPLQVASRKNKSKQNSGNVLSVNTRFAGAETHMAIVKLLKHLDKKYLQLKVKDDGSYWETGKADVLKKKVNAVKVGLDISKINADVSKDVVAKIEAVLSKT